MFHKCNELQNFSFTRNLNPILKFLNYFRTFSPQSVKLISTVFLEFDLKLNTCENRKQRRKI